MHVINIGIEGLTFDYITKKEKLYISDKDLF